MTILITGATGQVGGAVVRALGDVPVRVLVRDAEAFASAPGAPAGHGRAEAAGASAPAESRRAEAGAGAPPSSRRPEVVAGSFDDVRSLRAALDGVTVLFLTGRDNPDQVAQHLRVLEVAGEAGVRHVVKLSALGARADSPVALMRWHHAVEARLRDSPLGWTLLRPHLYMQNLLRFAGDVAGGGRLAAPMGTRSYPLVDTRDLGAAAATVLRDPGAHAGRAYALTGPAALTYAEVAAQLAALVGHPVAYEALEPDRFRAGLLEAGIPEWRADDLAAIGAAYTDADTTPSDDLAALLGRPATPLERFLADHRETYLAGASRSHL